ncbi:aminoglycoside phosphotransferase family protein [Novosphingobium umbonatum]|uniref:Aminoglycoside phosphotransferase family protein n=1 Tax=Novosphingobium umbonatum TaxID=1908524 RepID=A0A437N723_9SPHN|nr:phosphotransferase [Novosphingobium umbonatum]RVU05677.1 aminoglycoside phosphotransferase family protein [Novosphingobium umbonatum]
MGKELEKPVWPAITRDEAEAVLALFAQAGDLQALCWHSPRPFSAAVLVETERGRFFLKRHHARLRSPVSLAQEHGFMRHLRAQGIPVPEVMVAHGGQTAVAQGDWTYELHRMGQGQDLYREAPSWTGFQHIAHASAAGNALGRLHRAAQSYHAAARGPDPLIASCTILPADDPMGAAKAYVAARPALAGFLSKRPWQAELARVLANAPADLAARLAAQPRLWTHNDWHPSNLLWSPEGEVACVFDFGLATRTFALHDLATAIERCAIPWLDWQEGTAIKGDARAALALIEGYRQECALSADDLATMLDLLPLVHVEFALSEVDYFAGLVGDAAQAQQAWQAYLIDHADWFASPSGEDFLGHMREGLGL